MREVELVIFDCDGVLVDSEVLSCQCLVDIFRRHGVDIALSEVFDRFLGRRAAVHEAYFAEASRKPLPPDFRAEYRAHLMETFRTGLRAMPHVVKVLERLDRPYCLASSSGLERIELTLSVTGLAAYFDGRVFDGAMVTRGKPAPDLFLLAADRMSAAPERTLVIEDTVAGVEAGKAAGMTVWGFTGGGHHDEESGRRLAEAGADRLLTSMAEFSLQ
jgi:HAD superfamily hydrolase (TIGR01509 family)